jgi:DNA-binding MarR family transcriptional regulator
MPRAQTKALNVKRTTVKGSTARRRFSSPDANAVTLLPIVPSRTGAPPLARAASALARRFQLLCATMVAEALSGEEVVQLEYGTLVCLEIEPGVDQRRLAEAMGIDPSNASLIVDRLHSKGLIERRINGADRRARELYLTPKGKALWRRLRPKTRAANERVLAPLAPQERELLLDLLIRVIEENRAHVRPGAGRPKPHPRKLLSNKT